MRNETLPDEHHVTINPRPARRALAERVTISIVFPRRLMEEIRNHARLNDRSINAQVRTMLEEYLLGIGI